MEDRSEEQIISRLFDLENDGQAAQRAELTGERFISLIQDPVNGLGYVFQHGLDETEAPRFPSGQSSGSMRRGTRPSEPMPSSSPKTGRQASWWRRILRKALATRTPP